MSYKDLGFAVLRHRRLAHLSQQQLGDLAGISRNYVSIIERGNASGISVEVIGNLAKALGLETSYLVEVLEQDEKGKI